MEIISGTSRPDERAASLAAMMPALAFSVSKDRLDQDEVDTALDQRVALLAVHVLEAVEVDFAEAGIVDVGRQRQVLLVGPIAPATKRGRPSLASASRAAARARLADWRLMSPTRCSAA
jgi:hypothetical protein